VEFASKDPDNKPLRFDVHEALLRNVGMGSPLTYRVKVHNPQPREKLPPKESLVYESYGRGETPISGK